MDQTVQQFISFGAILLALAVFIITFFIRRSAELAFPVLVKTSCTEKDPSISTWWNQVILYAIPVIVGGLFGLMNAPLLFGDQLKTMSARCLFGGVVGWFSGFIYKIVKKIIGDKAGVTPDESPAVVDNTKEG